MSDSPVDDDYSPEYSLASDVRNERMAAVIGCPASLVASTWLEMNIDSFDDLVDLRELRNAVAIYGSALTHARRLVELLNEVPVSEHELLAVERNKTLNSMKLKIEELAVELESLHAHRVSVLSRNPTKGGVDQRADALAELVATIFEQTSRKVTFGQFDSEPTTHYCKAVREVLRICDNKKSFDQGSVDITNWRSPARKAFERRNLNTNQK